MIELVKTRFNSFTVIRGEGYWQGKMEFSLIIEIVGSSIDPNTDAMTPTHSQLLDLARDIKKLNNQCKVMVQAFRSYSVLI